MVKLLISIAVITACIAPRPSWGEAPGDTADTPDAIRRQLDAVSDAREKALLHKRLGDIFAERDDYSLAAGEYEAALSTPRGFSPEERLQMVERLSWAGKLGSAEKYARELLADKPDYFDARVTLARVLSWQEHLDDAIAEADLVLKVEHHHRGALLVKADSLRWKGNNHDAAAIYRALLAEQEEFGPRLGLAYTRISAGDLNGARESLRMLKPRFPYQERDMKALEGAVKEAAEAATAHRLSLRTSFYSDTDNNDVNRYGALYTYQMAPGTEMGAEYLHTYARDPTRAVNMDSLNIQGTATTGGGYVFGATAGLHQIDAPTDHRYVSGGGSVEGPIGKMTLSAGVSRDVLSDTAQIIENGIRVLAARASLSVPLYDRLSLFAGYAWREYSDSNHANDVTVSPSYALLAGNPSLRVAYRYRYLNFERQSFDGYFDPNNFMSHDLEISYVHEIGPFHLTLEPYGGIQSFNRYGIHNDDNLFGGISAVAAWKINRRITVDVSGEFGNYALGSASGFQYYVVNGRILFNF